MKTARDRYVPGTPEKYRGAKAAVRILDAEAVLAALEAALARESHLRGIIGGLNPGLDIDAALAAVPVETQEAAEPDDYSRPGWRMFPVL